MAKSLSVKEQAIIVSYFRKDPTAESILELAKTFGSTFGEISRILSKEPDLASYLAVIRGKNRQERVEANIRERAKSREVFKERLMRRRESLYSNELLDISPQTVRQVKLFPRSKNCMEILRQKQIELRKYLGWVKKVSKNKINTEAPQAYSDYVTKYNNKYGTPETIKTKEQQVFAKKLVGSFKSMIQNLTLESLPIPFQGDHKTLNEKKTTGNARIVEDKTGWRLHLGKLRFKIIMPEISDVDRDAERFKPLETYFRSRGCPSGEIYVRKGEIFCNFSLEREEVIPEVRSPLYIVVAFERDRFETMFFEDNKQIKKMTRPLDNTYLKVHKDSQNYKSILQKEIIGITNEIREKASKFVDKEHVFILCEPYRIITQDKEFNNFLIRIPFGLLKREFLSHVYQQSGLKGKVYTCSSNWSSLPVKSIDYLYKLVSN